MSVNSNNSGETSSIGAVWPPEAAPHNRIRGFYTDGIVELESDCRDMSNLITDYQSQLDEVNQTRLSIRFVAEDSTIKLFETIGVNVEAAIPLDGSDGLSLVYVGNNLPSRSADLSHFQAHRHNLEQTRYRQINGVVSGASKLDQLGYGYSYVDPSMSTQELSELTANFANLYGIFGYSSEDIEALLTNPANIVVFVENNGQVISTAMAERADIQIGGLGKLSMYEITEASTHPAYRGRGLYRAASGILIDRLAELQSSDPVQAIYGESNLTMRGVILAAHDNGRRFSYFDRQRLGLQNPNFGILEQNFKVEDGTETRPYNDFAVSYLPLNQEPNYA